MILRSFNVVLYTVLLLICQLAYCQTLSSPAGNREEADTIPQPAQIDIEGNISDTIPDQTNDTIPTEVSRFQISQDKLDCEVKRRSDSSRFIRELNVVEMYGNARIEYCDLVIEADQINYNTKTQMAEAFGTKDSLGNYVSYAKFTQGSQSFQYQTVKYNFKTEKARVTQIVTEQGEGIVRGREVKKINEDESFIKGTMYTTCNLEHPHYYFTFDKAKFKSNKFAAGKNLNLFIKDIPTPVYFPFAIFPLQTGKRAGFTRPKPGYDRQRGFELGNIGWYQPINDNMDALFTSNFYTDGSWDVNTNYRYSKIYKHRMNFDFRYSYVRSSSVSDVIDLSVSNMFQLNYQFNQDPKVWPNANLNANISLGQRNFRTLNVFDPNERLNSTYTSSVSFNKQFPNLPLSFSSNLRYNQNTQSGTVSLSLPDFNLSTNTLYPFRWMSKPGKSNPLETITFSYRTNFKNQINTVDSIFFANPINEITGARYGASHSIPVSGNFKLLKYFNLSPSFSYNEVWTSETYNQSFDPLLNTTLRDTLDGFQTARWYSYGMSLNTQIYGMKQFKKGKIQAIRHVMRPSLSFNYSPDFSANENYFRDVVTNRDGDTQLYSLFQGGLFGGPPSSSGGSIGFNLGNNLEMKVKSDSDTTGLKKVKIFESLNLNTSYNLKADSLNLSPINITGNTRLFDKYSVNVNARFDPYAVDPLTGRRTGTFYYQQNKGLADLTSASFRVSGSLNSKKSEGEAQREAQLISNPLYPQEQLFVDNYLYNYVDFNIPWDLNFSYNLSYNKSYGANGRKNHNLTNAVTGGVSFNLTDQWNVNGNTGFDFVSGEVNYTSININRDLHCWQMGFSWQPIGNFKRYMFTISPKSSLLRDLKLEKKRTVYDDFR